MTREDVIRAARDLGVVWGEGDSDMPEFLERFYTAAYAAGVADEREACARACDEQADKWRGVQDVIDFRLCALIIRARGEK